MSNDDKVRFAELLNTECDYKLPSAVIDKLLDAGQIIRKKRRETIIAAGERNPDIYITMEGVVRCWFWDGDKEVTTLFSMIPTLVISYHTYYGNRPSFYNFECCTPAKLMWIKRKDFDDLIHSSHEFAIWNLRVAQNQLFYFEYKQEVQSGQAKERYLKLVEELPELMPQLPLQTVASYLGISPQHLSRLRKELLQQGK